MERYKQLIESRLVSRLWVNPQTGCWEYQGFTPKPNGRQYPIMGVTVPDRKRRLALVHRVAAWLWLDIPLDPPPEILHDCDNKLCCSPNPGHIRAGTRGENMKDAYTRGLQPPRKGEANGRAKLTRKQVAQIRKLYATGKFSQTRLAKKFGITQVNVSGIVRGENWK